MGRGRIVGTCRRGVRILEAASKPVPDWRSFDWGMQFSRGDRGALLVPEWDVAV